MWSVAALEPSWWLVTLAVPVIGTRYYALFIIGHDGLHRRLFGQVPRNDLWNDVLILGAIGAITRLNRHNHIAHHQLMGQLRDPDRYKYLKMHIRSSIRLLIDLTAVPFILRATGNVFRPRQKHAPNSARREHYRLRDVAILVGWQLSLVGGLTATIGWWAYPILWLLPVYVFTFAADMFRVFCEHSTVEDVLGPSATRRLITFRSNWIERQFVAPMNMNFHAIHHLWPSIPYYHLARADAVVRDRVLSSDLVWRHSYLGYLWLYLRHLRKTANTRVTR